jgi:hypothetical protein
LKRTKQLGIDPGSCRLRIYPLPGASRWIGRVLKGDEQVGVTTICTCPEDVAAAAYEQGFELNMVIEHGVTDRRGDPFSIVRLHAALEGRMDADSLTNDERALFNQVLDESANAAHSLNESPCADTRTTDRNELNHLLTKARDARDGGRDAWSVQSTGEKLAVAMTLNRFDWLQAMDHTIPEAIERVGPQWVRLIPNVARTLRDEAEQ